jgi:hypothetical protein
MVAMVTAAAAAAAATTITAVAATATAAGTDNNQLKAVTAMANAGGDGNSDDDGGRRRRHDNCGGGKVVTHEAAGGDALIGTWAKAEAVDAAPAIYSDAGARTWIFLGRFFFARKEAFYGRTKLGFILPVVLLCYPKIPFHEKRYMPYIRKKWY